MSTQRAVLITGGSRGIGLALAVRHLAAGDRVVVTGRDGSALRRAAEEHEGLEVLAGDLGDPEDRVRLAARVAVEMPEIDVLINNAGVQRRTALAVDDAPWAERQAEIDVLLAAPVHLAQLLVPVMLRHGRPATIVNVTSGGALLPQPFAPVYSACKAAMHSFTTTLRHALADTPVRVVELLPPAVATGLAGAQDHGAPLDEFSDAVFPAHSSGADEVGFGRTASSAIRGRLASEREQFEAAADRFPVSTYGRGAHA
jgi:uncharacterized oxidoreductase